MERISGRVRRGKRMVMGWCDAVRPLGVRYCDHERMEMKTVEMRADWRRGGRVAEGCPDVFGPEIADALSVLDDDHHASVG